MVDAITSFNANKPTNPKKDLTINWNTLTVKEIDEYEDEGQEVPEYIQTWKKYIEHLASVPDDVTYATYYNPDANDSKYAPSDTNTSITSMLNAGINPSLATQAEINAKMCQDSITNVKNVTSQLKQIMKESDNMVEQAEARKDGLCDRIQTFQSRVNALQKEKSKNPLALMGLFEINQQVDQTAKTGEEVMDGYLLSVQNIGTQVNDTYDILKGANGLIKTVLSAPSENIKARMLTLKNSNELKKLAEEKKKDVKSAVEQQEGNEDTVIGYKKNISSTANNFTTSGTEGSGGTSGGTSGDTSGGTTNSKSSKSAKADAKNDTKNAATKQKNAQTTKKSKEEKSQSLADEKILTDPNEILKLKQKRGEA